MTDHQEKPFGRPTKYTPELADKICEAVATHGHGLRRLGQMYDWMPLPETICAWRVKYGDFSARYLDSRRTQTHAMFESAVDEIQKIEEYYYQDPVSGAMKVDSGIVAAQKAIANQKTIQAARINPRDYATTKNTEETSSPQETLTKIAAMVADLNKVNDSEI